MLLDECLFEDWDDARPNEAKVYDLIDNGILNWETVGSAALSQLSDDDVGELARQCSWFNNLDEAIVSKKGKEKLKQNLKENDNDEENLSESVSKDAQEVVNPVMADAIRDQEEAEKVKEQATKITKDGKPTIKNESLDVYNALDALNVFNENLKKTK